MAPVPPTDPVFSNIKDTSVVVTSQHGGTSITRRRFAYNLDPTVMGATYVNAPNTNPFSVTISSLQPGTRYYVASQVANGPQNIDWSAFSEWMPVTTYNQPLAPDAPTFSGITSSSVTASAHGNGSGGAPVLEREFGYGTSSVTPTTTVDATNASPQIKTITGLARATTYYVWARIRTNVGWSAWSPRSQFTTLPTVPDKPAAPIPGVITQTTVPVKSTDPNNGGSAILERQVSWDTSPTGSANTMASDLDDVISNLLPATTYYIRFRTRNSIGWSSWSDALVVHTMAGVWIKVGAEWKGAIPWVNVNGVWKRATPWNKILGVWKETK